MSIAKWRLRSERGDTIVEVLIAIAVMSLILAGAFVTTNHSLQATRDSQEHSNALKLVESQIEQVKNLAVTNPTALFGAGVPSPFCVTSAGAVVASSSASCAVDSNDNPTAAQPVYHLLITAAASPIGTPQHPGSAFTVKVSWLAAVSSTTNSEQMVYRVYQ